MADSLPISAPTPMYATLVYEGVTYAREKDQVFRGRKMRDHLTHIDFMEYCGYSIHVSVGEDVPWGAFEILMGFTGCRLVVKSAYVEVDAGKDTLSQIEEWLELGCHQVRVMRDV